MSIIYILNQYNHIYASLYAPVLHCHKNKFVALFTKFVALFRKIYQGYIPCPYGTLNLVPHPVLGSLHLHIHFINVNLIFPRYWDLNLLLWSFLLLRCYRMVSLQKVLNMRKGHYLIHLLWI